MAHHCKVTAQRGFLVGLFAFAGQERAMRAATKKVLARCQYRSTLINTKRVKREAAQVSDVFVHPHALKHGLSEDEILYAWSNFVRSQMRQAPQEDQCVRVGYGRHTPQAIQMVGIVRTFGVLIIHAMTPPQASILRELGIPRG